MTSQDYSTNCVSDEAGGDEDHFNQSESETELHSQYVGEPIEKRQIPKATCGVTDSSISISRKSIEHKMRHFFKYCDVRRKKLPLFVLFYLGLVM